MKTNYIFIDFENVQPKTLGQLSEHPFKVIVFVGANQSKVPFELVTALQQLGDDAQYIKIAGNGTNALDFHIAYYIGELTAKDPDGNFHIISKDTGFDRLIEHLRKRKIPVQRSKDISDIPMLKISNAKTKQDKLKEVIKKLELRGNHRPRKEQTLINTIKAMFLNKLKDEEVLGLVTELKNKKLIVIQDSKVTYSLSK